MTTERRPPVIQGPPRKEPSGNHPSAGTPPTRPPTGAHPPVRPTPVHGFRVPSGSFGAVPNTAPTPSGGNAPSPARAGSGTYPALGGTPRQPSGSFPVYTPPRGSSGTYPALGGAQNVTRPASATGASAAAPPARAPSGAHEDVGIVGLLTATVGFLRAALMYAPEHPHGVQAAQRFAAQLPSMIENLGGTEIVLIHDGRHIHSSGRSVRVDSPDLDRARWLIERLQRYQIAEIILRQGVSEIDLVAFARAFMDAEKTGAFAEFSTPTIVASHARFMPEFEHLLQTVLPLSRYPLVQLYAEAIALTMGWARIVHDRKPVDIIGPRSLVGQLVDACNADPSGMLGLVTLQPLPGSISNRRLDTAIAAITIAQALELDDNAALEIGVAALLRPLPTPWQPWWTRTTTSAEACADLARHATGELTRVITYECTAGPGITLPATFYGSDSIRHVASRIVSVAEAWIDLLQPGQVSNPASPDIALLALVAQAGTLFDAAAVRALMQKTGIFPPGTVVRLNSGDIAVVTHAPPAGTDPRRPTVRPLDASATVVYPLHVAELAAYHIAASEQPVGTAVNPVWAFLR